MVSSIAIICILLSVHCLAAKIKPTPNGAEMYMKMVEHETQNYPIPKQAAGTYSILGRAMQSDSGTGQRAVDVIGWVDLTSGLLTNPFILTSVVGGEGTYDGICAYDWKTKQAFYASDASFGGTVFFADMNNNTVIPPQYYGLSPVNYLGYDPLSGSRVVAGVENPTLGLNFLVLEKPGWGQLTSFGFPRTIIPTIVAVFDGKTMNHYSAYCPALGSCSFTTWNVKSDSVGNFSLNCIPSEGYLEGKMWITLKGTIQALVHDRSSAKNAIINIDPAFKSCSVVVPELPGSSGPNIIISQDYGYLSGNLYLYGEANGGASINVYDAQFSLLRQIKTYSYTLNDIFVHEN